LRRCMQGVQPPRAAAWQPGTRTQSGSPPCACRRRPRRAGRGCRAGRCRRPRARAGTQSMSSTSRGACARRLRARPRTSPLTMPAAESSAMPRSRACLCQPRVTSNTERPGSAKQKQRLWRRGATTQQRRCMERGCCERGRTVVADSQDLCFVAAAGAPVAEHRAAHEQPQAQDAAAHALTIRALASAPTVGAT